MAEDIEMEDENFLELILSNLFRKDSNGEAIDFYLRRTRLGRQDNVEKEEKFKKLKEQIKKCGGHLGEEPRGCHAIELVFPEYITDIDGIDSDLFKAEYIEECMKCGDLLDLEQFRLGKSPYSSININMIMKGYETWDSVSRTSPQKGRKLPDFGLPLQTSPEKFKSNNPGKKSRRVEYSIEEDLAILRFLLANNLYDKVGGNATWKIVHRTFPNHSYQSLHNRFRRFILPNLKKYKGLTNSERNLFSRVSFSGNSSASSPDKSVEIENGSISSCSVSPKKPTTIDKVASVDEQESPNISLSSVREKINQTNETVIVDELITRGKKHVSSSKVEEMVHLQITEEITKEENNPLQITEEINKEENNPLTPSCLAMILNNLFRKESNGDPIEFYMRRTRSCHHENNLELEGKCSKLKEQIEKCGGNFGETPHSCHSIELVFPEVIEDIDEIDSDVFKAEYVEECIKCGDLLDLENFRLGKSPYDGSININNILKGHDSWEAVTRTSPRKGKKLLHSGSSSEKVESCSSGKKILVEYSIEEDLAILKCLLYKNLHDKVERNTTWKIVNREFHKHSLQSLQNRFRQFILPNLDTYKGLTKSERNLFSRSMNENSRSSSSERKKLSMSQNESSTADEISDSEPNVVSMPSPTKVKTSSPRVIAESSLSGSDLEDLESVKSLRVREITPKRAGDFSVELDKCILQYIILNKRYSDISGRKLWMDIQGSCFKTTGQDWKSIKRRFHDVILKDLESKEYALEKNVIQRFRSNESSSSSERDSDIDEDKLVATSSVKPQKSVPRLYTLEEDKLIIDYIAKTNRYEEVRGKKLWVDIQDKILHKYNRSWESAKNRFLRNIFKNLGKFNLSPDIVKKFKHGAVVERNLGGCQGGFLDKKSERSGSSKKKRNVVEVESEEEELPKHPALATNKIPTPSKKQKRQLFKQPVIPLPIVFSPHPAPSRVNKKRQVESKPNEKKEDSETGVDKMKSKEAVSNLATSPTKPDVLTEAVPALVTTSPVPEASSNCPLPKPLRSAPSVQCSVVVKRLTQQELEKYGCKISFTHKNSSSTHVQPSPTLPPLVIPPGTLPPESPATTSRFTVEISPCLLAARLNAAGSSVPSIGSANRETVLLPLPSPLSRKSIRKSDHPRSTKSKDDVDEVSSPEATTRMSSEDSPLSATSSTTTEENCNIYDEINNEADLATEVDSSVPTNPRNLPFQTKIPNENLARLIKDDQSSDGYHTPVEG
ncbi:uncharacterized protein LOC124188577 isoform X1 [Daphnia pulex]|uniref:uncharacterized protein LOC124188577 isoform X1 n=1 Tax=Daphnia pulex TaxID=6669 RepID=UPI001EDE1DA3|nr:uncharacterized protein LOC124188577 isoform X1 [Daphnia pulex]